MLPIYEGMLKVFELVTYSVKCGTNHGSLTLVAFHQLKEILKATEHAVTHYLTLTLNEHFLQNSHLGTPYQKWSYFTNDNFKKVDDELKALIPLIQLLLPSTMIEYKLATMWLSKLSKGYKCCVVEKDKPALLLSSICFDDWLASDDDKFEFKSRLLLRSSVSKQMKLDITDRTILAEVQHDGYVRVEELRTSLRLLAVWIMSNFSLEEIVKVPEKRNGNFNVLAQEMVL